MARRNDLPSRARHLIINDIDWDFLTELYGKGSAKPIGVSQAIRTIVHGKCQELRQKYHDRIDAAVAAQEEAEEASNLNPEDLEL